MRGLPPGHKTRGVLYCAVYSALLGCPDYFPLPGAGSIIFPFPGRSYYFPLLGALGLWSRPEKKLRRNSYNCITELQCKRGREVVGRGRALGVLAKGSLLCNGEMFPGKHFRGV